MVAATLARSRTWTFDEDGTPWLRGNRQRSRGEWKGCEHCGEHFPALSVARFCSRSCSARANRPAGGHQDAFAAWTPDEAWLAGLIWADGSLVPSARSALERVKVGGVDRETIEAAASILGVKISTHNPGGRRKPMHTVAIFGRPVERLKEIGLARGKTFSGGLPDLGSLGHAAAFVRGFFDGDGTVGLYVNPGKVTQEPRLKSHFVGTEQSMTELRELLVERAGVRRNKVCTHSRTHFVRQLFFGHADSLRIADFLYSEPGPFLGRKRAIFDAGRALRPLKQP